MLEGLDEDGEEQKSPSNGGVGGKKPKLKDVFDLSWSAKIVTKKLEMLPKTSDDNNTENVEKSTDNEIAGFSLDHLPSQETLLSMNDVMKEAPQPVPAPVISARYSTSTTPSLMAKSEFVESSAPESLVATQTAKQERQVSIY